MGIAIPPNAIGTIHASCGQTSQRMPVTAAKTHSHRRHAARPRS
jgi:hypothetical protein